MVPPAGGNCDDAEEAETAGSGFASILAFAGFD